MLFTFAAVLATSPSAHAEDEAPASDLDIGVRMGVGVTTVAGKTAPIGSIHLDMQLPRDRFFLSLAPGLYLPGNLEGSLSYGALGVEIGAGWLMTRSVVTPYLGAGLSGRLQFSDGTNVLGGAPYAQLGVTTQGFGDGQAFAELRAYQNVFPVKTELGTVYPTELGVHVGLRF